MCGSSFWVHGRTLCALTQCYCQVSVGVDACIDPRADASIRPYNLTKNSSRRCFTKHP